MGSTLQFMGKMAKRMIMRMRRRRILSKENVCIPKDNAPGAIGHTHQGGNGGLLAKMKALPFGNAPR